MDIWTKSKRSEVMSKIRSKNTKPEVIFRKALFKNRYRYRIHVKSLPGKPDIVLPKYKTAIFIHGCFWHFHKDCPDGRIPSTNSEFWKKKLTNTMARDTKQQIQLEKMGWKVIILWECEIEKDLDTILSRVTSILSNP